MPRQASLTLLALFLAISFAFAGPVGARSPWPLLAHAAATCADYPDQASAQRAHDTRDADGDGIYCESLPCPCLKPGQGGGTHKKKAKKPTPPRLGRSINLSPVTKHTGCLVRGPLPDPTCTPGAYYQKASRARVCKAGYSKQVRNVTQATKSAVYAAYAISGHFNGKTGEVDHLVSLELGGSNVRSNLFPEAAAPKPGSHEKDKLENRLHAEVCSGKVSLRKAQRTIAGDWVSAYHHEFG